MLSQDLTTRTMTRRMATAMTNSPAERQMPRKTLSPKLVMPKGAEASGRAAGGSGLAAGAVMQCAPTGSGGGACGLARYQAAKQLYELAARLDLFELLRDAIDQRLRELRVV